MTANIFKDTTTCDCANEHGGPDILRVGDVVELRDAMPKQGLEKGHRAFVDEIFSDKGNWWIRILPFGRPKRFTVKVKEISKLNWA